MVNSGVGAMITCKDSDITIPQLGNISFFCFVTITVDAWKIFNEPYTADKNYALTL